jgi:hypothetical protein
MVNLPNKGWVQRFDAVCSHNNFYITSLIETVKLRNVECSRGEETNIEAARVPDSGAQA